MRRTGWPTTDQTPSLGPPLGATAGPSPPCAGADAEIPPGADGDEKGPRRSHRRGGPVSLANDTAATVWEIAIKQAAGRLDAPLNLMSTLDDNDFDTLPMTASHALDAARLPAYHADPFDRMLIAQAVAEDLTLVTVDRRFTRYDVTMLPLG